MQLEEGPPVPLFQIYYGGWSRKKLDLVRESFKQGMILTVTKQPDGSYEFHLATKERIVIQENAGDHTDALRAPAWDAQLANVEGWAQRQFQAGRRCGGYLLALQSTEWEFVAVVQDRTSRAEVGELGPRRILMPGRNVTA